MFGSGCSDRVRFRSIPLLGVRSHPVAQTCGISGGSGAGKTTLTRRLMQELGPDGASVIAFDSYYRDQGHLSPADRSLVNYDHPDSLDHELFARDVDRLRAGSAIEVPIYDFSTHTRTKESTRVEPSGLVIVEGILLLSFPGIVSLLDLAVFIDVPEDVRLERRIRRDVAERGREPKDVRRQFAATVAPMHDMYVEPYRHLAHRILELHEDYGDVSRELASRFNSVDDATG